VELFFSALFIDQAHAGVGPRRRGGRSRRDRPLSRTPASSPFSCGAGRFMCLMRFVPLARSSVEHLPNYTPLHSYLLFWTHLARVGAPLYFERFLLRRCHNLPSFCITRVGPVFLFNVQLSKATPPSHHFRYRDAGLSSKSPPGAD